MQTVIYTFAIAYLVGIALLLVVWALSWHRENKATKQPLKFESLTNNNKNMKTLDQLIAESKGKFFSVTFVKKDGSIRVINGKDKYRRLIAGSKDSPNPNPVRNAGYISFVNRNKGNWASAHKDGVLVFKCGSIKQELTSV